MRPSAYLPREAHLASELVVHETRHPAATIPDDLSTPGKLPGPKFRPRSVRGVEDVALPGGFAHERGAFSAHDDRQFRALVEPVGPEALVVDPGPHALGEAIV